MVAFRTPTAVVLGADSAMTGFDRYGREVAVAADGCKIGQAGHWFVAWGGHVAGGTATDLRSAFARAIGPTRTLPALTGAVRRFIATEIHTLDWSVLGYDVGRVVFWVGVGRVARDPAGVQYVGKREDLDRNREATWRSAVDCARLAA